MKYLQSKTLLRQSRRNKRWSIKNNLNKFKRFEFEIFILVWLKVICLTNWVKLSSKSFWTSMILQNDKLLLKDDLQIENSQESMNCTLNCIQQSLTFATTIFKSILSRFKKSIAIWRSWMLFRQNDILFLFWCSIWKENSKTLCLASLYWIFFFFRQSQFWFCKIESHEQTWFTSHNFSYLSSRRERWKWKS